MASMRRSGKVSGVYISSATILPASARRSSRVNCSGAWPMAFFASLATLAVTSRILPFALVGVRDLGCDGRDSVAAELQFRI